MVMENATQVVITTPITDIGFWASIFSIVLVGVLIWQVLELRKTTVLAHTPYIIPRQREMMQTGRVKITFI